MQIIALAELFTAPTLGAGMISLLKLCAEGPRAQRAPETECLYPS